MRGWPWRVGLGYGGCGSTTATFHVVFFLPVKSSYRGVFQKSLACTSKLGGKLTYSYISIYQFYQKKQYKAIQTDIFSYSSIISFNLYNHYLPVCLSTCLPLTKSTSIQHEVSISGFIWLVSILSLKGARGQRILMF